MILVPEILDPVMRYGTTDYTLSKAITDYDIDQNIGEVVESVIDGTVSSIHHGKRFSGEITVYGISAATYASYKALERLTVRLWPFGRGGIPNTSPAKYYPYTDVHIEAVTPFHADNKLFIDAAIIRFKSVSYYTMVQASDTGIQET